MKQYDSYSSFLKAKKLPSDFSKWLAAQNDRDDPIGDVARDARSDSNAPWAGQIKNWESYLIPIACYKAIKAFQKAIKEYRIHG